MKRCFLALSMVFFSAFPAAAEEPGLAERINALEQNTNSINAMLSRQRADIANLQASVDALTSKVDALAKAQGVALTASSPDWAGTRTFSATSQHMPTSMPMMDRSMYSMGMGGGSCAGGSCGGGGRGLFGRRR